MRLEEAFHEGFRQGQADGYADGEKGFGTTTTEVEAFRRSLAARAQSAADARAELDLAKLDSPLPGTRVVGEGFEWKCVHEEESGIEWHDVFELNDEWNALYDGQSPRDRDLYFSGFMATLKALVKSGGARVYGPGESTEEGVS